jgi:hypothetical protein
MSFYTLVHYCRPLAPPIVAASKLAAFLREIDRLQISSTRDLDVANVKFGESIDQDDDPLSFVLPIDDRYEEIVEIDWDVIVENQSLQDVADAIAKHEPRHVYRAFIDLGDATDEICRSAAPRGASDNPYELALHRWSLNIFPIAAATHASLPEFAGWMSLALSGPGLLFPDTFSDLATRLESTHAVRDVMRLCSDTWPVPSIFPDASEIARGRRLADRWPYAELDRPWDWHWVLEAT